MDDHFLKVELDGEPLFENIFNTKEYNARLIYDLSYHSFGNFKNDNIEFLKNGYIVKLDYEWERMEVYPQDFINNFKLLLELNSRNSAIFRIICNLMSVDSVPVEIINKNTFFIKVPFYIPGFIEFLTQSYFITPVNKLKVNQAQKYIWKKLLRKNEYGLFDNEKLKIKFIINSNANETLTLLRRHIIDISTSTNIPSTIQDVNFPINYANSNLIYFFETSDDKIGELLKEIRPIIQTEYLKKFPSKIIPVDSFIYDYADIKKETKLSKINKFKKPIVISYAGYQQNKEIISIISSVLQDIKQPFTLTEYNNLTDLCNDRSSSIKLSVTYREYSHYSSYLIPFFSIVENPNDLLKYWLCDDIERVKYYLDKQNRAIPIFRGKHIYFKNKKAHNWRYDENGYLRRS